MSNETANQNTTILSNNQSCLISFKRLEVKLLGQHEVNVVQLHELLLVCPGIQICDTLVQLLYRLDMVDLLVLMNAQIHHHDSPN